jgi:hypothetical protein
LPGQGTTAQAVLNLNKEDGGKRRFILVSSTEATADAPDKNFCRDVCAERVRRVIAGYTNKKGQATRRARRWFRLSALPAHSGGRGVSRHRARTGVDGAATDSRRGAVALSVRIADADGARQTRGLVIYLPKLTPCWRRCKPRFTALGRPSCIHGNRRCWRSADRSAHGLRADSGVSGQPLRRARLGGNGRTVMSAPAPKGYQREAVSNALEIFRYAESQFRQAGDDASRAAATAFNGCLLLEAPTGSGKTLMAGMIAETFAAPDRDANAQIVWFWFTPSPLWSSRPKGRSSPRSSACACATCKATARRAAPRVATCM